MTELLTTALGYGLDAVAVIVIAVLLLRKERENTALVNKILELQQKQYMQQGEIVEVLRNVIQTNRSVTRRLDADQLTRQRKAQTVGFNESETG